jgi:hypothetical protein
LSVLTVLISHLYFPRCTSQVSTGLKGTRKLQFGGISLASATTNGEASSVNALIGQMSGDPTIPTMGVTGNGLTTGTSFGSSNTFSPGLGNSQATGAANGFGNSTATQVGGTALSTGAIAEEITFGNGFGDFDASGGGSSSFGSPLGIPGSGTPYIPGTPATAASEGSKNGGATAATAATPAQAATPAVFVNPLQTGGGGGGFGFTFGGGVGNASGDSGSSEAYGTAQSAGFGSAQGTSLFGQAGGSGGGTSDGGGGGNAAATTFGTLLTPVNGITAFNGTGGGVASGGAGAYVGFNPNVPVILGVFPIGGP